VLDAYWLEAQNIEDVDVLTEIARSLGLDGDTFRAALDDPQYTELVDEDINTARMYGLQGVPALILDQKYLIPGAVPYPTLRQAVEQVQAEQ
jgi:predicted DsbA family dithiol-disulfide isomerase